MERGSEGIRLDAALAALEAMLSLGLIDRSERDAAEKALRRGLGMEKSALHRRN